MWTDDSRFWTLFEAFFAMMKATPHGVRKAEDAERRYAITCIHNADKMFDKPKLVKKLSTKSLEELHELLSKPDIQLTTAKDKDTMLPTSLLGEAPGGWCAPKRSAAIGVGH